MLGDLATVNAGSASSMLVTLIVLLVPCIHSGWPATRPMLFPLGFLYFRGADR